MSCKWKAVIWGALTCVFLGVFVSSVNSGHPGVAASFLAATILGLIATIANGDSGTSK